MKLQEDKGFSRVCLLEVPHVTTAELVKNVHLDTPSLGVAVQFKFVNLGTPSPSLADQFKRVHLESPGNSPTLNLLKDNC